MENEFKTKKIYALVFAVLTGLSILYSIFISPYQTPSLTESEKILNQEIKLVSQHVKNGTNYWVEFGFVGEQDIFRMTELKYLYYKRLKSNLKTYDTLKISFDKDKNIFSINYKGQDYIETKKLLIANKANRSYWLFFRTVIFFAMLPILFFKNQPKFWHSGFEFDFKFTYLFFIILGLSILIYFYLYGYDYVMSFDIKDLK